MSMAAGHDATRLAGPTIMKAADLGRGLLKPRGLSTSQS